MRLLLQTRVGLLVALALAMILSAAAAPPPVRVMLLTGVNHHDWRATTPEIAAVLREAGRFDVKVVVTPPLEAPVEAWETNRLSFKGWDVVVMNWTDYGKHPSVMPWMNDLTAFVTNGGALVVLHAASLEFHPDWPGIVGLGWHEATFGDRLTVSDAGEVMRTANGQGPGSGHGNPFAWPVTMRAAAHPLALGLPPVWLHANDELWHGTRGPANNLGIIATAFSPLTKTNEPVMWTVEPGRGRVFVTLLGHNAPAMQCPGFRHTLARGTEWAATGRVTVPVPANFPTAISSDAISNSTK